MSAGAQAHSGKRRLLFLLFCLSGACGLVYELVWMRRLALIFGSTTLAISTVLAAFMGGLALGSWWLGRYADRRPREALKLYGRLEIAIGLLALAIPLLFRGAEAIYLALYPHLEGAPWIFFLLQFFLVTAVIVVPTTLMGGTLPLMARFFVARLRELGGRVGALYAANTFGAAGGAALATYVLLPKAGISATEMAAAAVNLSVGGVAILLQRSLPAPALLEPQEPAAAEGEGRLPVPREARVLLFGIALSGFAAMVLEVVWSRTLGMVLGSSVYAFGMMLLVFLAGLSLGSALFARLSRKPRRAVWTFALAQTGIAAAGLLAVLLIPRLPALFLRLFPLARESFLLLQLAHLLVAAALLLPAAVLFGMAYPAVIAASTDSLRTVGRGVGRVTAWNTAGTVAGAFLGGFVLIPGLGLRAALFTAAAASAAAATAALWVFALPRRRFLTAAAAALLALVLLLPPWPREILASGAGFFAPIYRSVEGWRAATREMEILFYKDGINTTLSVDRDANNYRFYRSNGKTDASTHPIDMAVQIFIGELPMLLHPDPKDVFVLGLGTGVSAAEVARYPVRSIDIVDIEPAGREAARFFEPENRRVLEDPRVAYINADGRNALLGRRKTYDVIISDPSDVWVAGMGNLFTKEFYEIARSRLRPGGVICQWWHTHALQPEHMKLIIATFRSVFPHASYWRPNLGDVIMVGTREPLAWDYERVKTRYETAPGLAEDLQALGLWHPLSIFAAFVLEGRDLDRLVAGVRGVHTDDHPVIEFQTPRALYADTPLANETVVQALQTQFYPPMTSFDRGRDVDARATYLLGFGHASLNRFDSAIRLMEESVRLDPSEPKYWIGLGNQYRGKGLVARAMEAYRRVLAASPGEPEATLDLAAMLRDAGDDAGAEEILNAALRKAPGDPALLAGTAGLWIDTGRSAEALPPLLEAVERNPGNGELRRLAGRALAAAGRTPEALAHLRQAVALAGNDAEALRSAAEALLEAGAPEEAGAAFERAAALDPANVEGLVGLARAALLRGDLAAAREARDRAKRLDPDNPAVLALSW